MEEETHTQEEAACRRERERVRAIEGDSERRKEKSSECLISAFSQRKFLLSLSSLSLCSRDPLCFLSVQMLVQNFLFLQYAY
jgi:hypothetical protein